MANTNGTAFPAATTPYPRRCMCFGSPAKQAPPHRPRGDTRANAAAREQSLRLIPTPFQNILFKNPQDAKSAETAGVPDFWLLDVRNGNGWRLKAAARPCMLTRLQHGGRWDGAEGRVLARAWLERTVEACRAAFGHGEAAA